MIVVRDIFQLQFGKAKEATVLLKKGREALERDGYPAQRLLGDVTGDYYTLVMESTFDDLDSFESSIETVGTSEAWQDVYKRFTPLVRKGRREVFRIIE
jgi:hypothetical protein